MRWMHTCAARRLREEAQGQRRLVSFGGGIALSAGSSQQGSNAGRGTGGGSQADACEISSDESDVNRNNTGGTNDSSEDDDDASPFEKRARSSSGTVRPRGASGVGEVHGKPPADERRSKRRGTPSRSSLEAVERIINGEDDYLGSPPSSPTDNGRVPRGARGGGGGGENCGGAKEGGAGASGDKDAEEDSDDCCEIVFTRVSRPARTSSSSSSAQAQAQARPRHGSPAVGKEAGRASTNTRDRPGSSSSRRRSVLSDLSEGGSSSDSGSGSG